jgi:hypothetical protein
MARTLEAIDVIVTNLQARVNQLDGSGLPVNEKSTIAQLTAEINGLRTTLRQAVLGMEADRLSLQDDLKALIQLVQAHLGASSE